MNQLSFQLERRVRLPGLDWGQWRVEAQCRHVADVMALVARRNSSENRQVETDSTGRQVQAEYRVISTHTGQTLKSFIVGV